MSEDLELRFLSREDIEQLGVTPEDVVAAVEQALEAQGRGQTTLDPRVQHMPEAGFPGHFNVLRATVWPVELTGVKVVGDFIPNYEHGLPSELALVLLLDPRTGAPRAILDGTTLTEQRTGGLTAVGARHLARPGSAVLGHVGSRGTAFWNVTLLDALFDFDEIRVTSRREESRREFGALLERTLEKPIRVVDSVRKAVEGADIVVEATRLVAPEPILHTAWLETCTLLVPYGTMSALELDVLDRVDKVVVDDWGQCARDDGFGALRPHVRAGRLSESTLHAELAQIVVGERLGRERDDERIVFWHRGLATTDVTLAASIYRRAVAAGVGTVLRYR